MSRQVPGTSTDRWRNAIALAIETGGLIQIEGTEVIGHSVGHESSDDPTLVRIVQALL